MENLSARLLFRIKGTDNVILSSYSEEILVYFEAQSVQLNKGKTVLIEKDIYRIEDIETTIAEKMDKVYGITLSKQIGNSFPESITITYVISKVEN